MGKKIEIGDNLTLFLIIFIAVLFWYLTARFSEKDNKIETESTPIEVIK